MTLENINFPFGTMENLLFLGVPILQHITVYNEVVCANNIDPDEVAHPEPVYLDLLCLPSTIFLR